MDGDGTTVIPDLLSDLRFAFIPDGDARFGGKRGARLGSRSRVRTTATNALGARFGGRPLAMTEAGR
jgi:hypothetical protein